MISFEFLDTKGQQQTMTVYSGDQLFVPIADKSKVYFVNCCPVTTL